MAKKTTPQALKFDSQTYVHIGTAPSLGLTERDFTVETWIQYDEPGTGDKTILGSELGVNNQGLHLILRDRRPYMGFYYNDLAGRTELQPKVWYHLAWRYTKATQEMAIFVNGILDAAAGGHAAFQGQGDIFIGRSSSDRPFNGMIAEVRIWNYARPAKDILGNMQRRLSGAESGLTGYWHLDDGAGKVAADSTQHILDGQLQGEPAWTPLALPFPWDKPRVLTLDGNKDRVTVSPFNDFPAQALTFECWLRSGNITKAGTVVSYASKQVDDAFALFDIRNLVPVINKENKPSGVAFNDGLWHHLAFTWQMDSGLAALYKDGEKAFECVLSKGKPIASDGSFVLGQEQDTVLGGFDPMQAFKGELAEVRLWKVARSAAQIKRNMNVPLKGNEEDLVSYWRLDNAPDSFTRDLSATPRRGEFNGPNWVDPSGPILENKDLISLDGVDDFLQVPPEIWFQGDLTVEAWVYVRKYANWIRLIDFGNAPGMDNVLFALSWGETGRPAFQIYHANQGTSLETNLQIPLRRWVHVAATLQGAMGRLYIDGQEIAANANMFPPRAVIRNQNYIGRSNWSVDAYANAIFNELRIWSRACSREEIVANRSRRLEGNENGLVACWHLDEGRGESAANVARRQTKATIQGAAWVKPEPPIPTQSGKSLSFDGEDDYVSVAIDLPESEMTHELWFRTPEANAGIFSVVDQDLGNGGHDRHLYLRDGNLAARIWNDETIVTSGLNLADNQWHHVAHVFGASIGGQQRIYVDGKLQANGNKAASDFNWQKHINIGFSNDARSPHFKGQICEVRIWNKARTAEEINAMLYRRATSTDPNLIGCWHLDEGEDAIIHDTSLLQRDGFLSGPSWEGYTLPIAEPGEKVLSLDGKDDLVFIEGFAWESRGPITIEFWTKVNESDVANRSLFSISDQENPNRCQAHVPWGDHILYWDYGDLTTTGRLSTSFAPYLECWTHVALVSQGENGNFMGIYLNGRLAASAPRSDAPKVRLRGLSIGCFKSAFHKGQISDFRIWRRVRGEGEIRASMHNRLNGTEPDLVGYWKLDQTAGDSLAVRPGQITGGDWANLDAPIHAKAGEDFPTTACANFEGGDDHIAITPNEIFNALQTTTLEAWVRPTSNVQSAFQAPVVGRHGVSAGWELRCGGGKASVMMTINRAHYDASLDQGIALNQWVHLAGVYDGQAIHLYINGVLKASTVVSGPLTPYLGDLNIGRNPRWPERLFTGQIAEVRIWNRARSGAEIQATLFQCLEGNEPGLVGYWKLDEGNGEKANDSSPLKQHGVLRGVTWAPSEMPLAVIGRITEVEIDLQAQLKATRLERDALQAKLEENSSQLRILQQNVEALTKSLEDLRKEKSRLEAEQVTLQQNYAQEIKQINTQHVSALEKLKTQGGEVSLAQLIKNANDAISRAREDLLKQGGNYRLGRVSMELKMLPGTDGTSMIFPKREELSQIGDMSTVNLDFSPKEVAEEVSTLGNEVPSVIGYTELLAQRKLSEAGFTMEIQYQAVKVEEGKPSQEDRVVNQFPKPQERAKPFSAVTVLIGKRS